MKKVFILLLVLLLMALVTFKKTSEYPKDTIIVTAHWNEDLDWLKDAPYDVVVCDKEGASAHNLGDFSKSCPPTINKGTEASAYLNYIVNNYDSLSDYTIFIHGHETSWHQTENMIELFKKREYVDKKFHSFNNIIKVHNNLGKCPKNECTIWEFTNNIWKEQFEDVLGPMKEDITSGNTDCCAQFAVQKEQIRKVPKEIYERWLKWCLYTEVDVEHKNTGHIFEILWEEILRHR